jgi:hypothetical protein
VVANLTMGSCSVCPYSGQLRRVTASRLLFPSRRSFVFPAAFDGKLSILDRA